MTKKIRLQRCDRILLVLTLLTLASGIRLEATHCREAADVWLHIVAASLFTATVVWHIFLHFGWKSWGRKFRSQHSPLTRWLSLSGFLTLAMAIAASVHWFATATHSPFGGIHGKVGFLFTALAIGHTAKRFYFFKTAKSRKRKATIPNHTTPGR